jgi:hypothetical protein
LGKLRGEGRGHFFITFWSFLRHFYVTSKPRDRGKKEHSGRFRGPAGLQERACATLRPGGRRMGPCGSFRVGNGGRRPGVVTSEWLVRGWLWGSARGRTAVRARRPPPAVAAAAPHGPRRGGKRAARETRNLPLSTCLPENETASVMGEIERCCAARGCGGGSEGGGGRCAWLSWAGWAGSSRPAGGRSRETHAPLHTRLPERTPSRRRRRR